MRDCSVADGLTVGFSFLSENPQTPTTIVFRRWLMSMARCGTCSDMGRTALAFTLFRPCRITSACWVRPAVRESSLHPRRWVNTNYLPGDSGNNTSGSTTSVITKYGTWSTSAPPCLIELELGWYVKSMYSRLNAINVIGFSDRR